MKYKKGMILKSKTSNVYLKLVQKKGGNKHWTANQINRNKSHTIHEGTLEKFYEIMEIK